MKILIIASKKEEQELLKECRQLASDGCKGCPFANKQKCPGNAVLIPADN